MDNKTVFVNEKGEVVCEEMTHIEAMRMEYAAIERQVEYLTKMTHAQLYQFMYDTGMAWLAGYTGDDADLITTILSQPAIWAWWRNEWSRRDAKYLHLLYGFDTRMRLCEYRAMHQEIFIHTSTRYVQLEAGYAKAFGRMRDNLKAGI